MSFSAVNQSGMSSDVYRNPLLSLKCIGDERESVKNWWFWNLALQSEEFYIDNPIVWPPDTISRISSGLPEGKAHTFDVELPNGNIGTVNLTLLFKKVGQVMKQVLHVERLDIPSVSESEMMELAEELGLRERLEEALRSKTPSSARPGSATSVSMESEGRETPPVIIDK